MNTEQPNTLDLYFGDARSKLIDLGAFMDRVERNGDTEDFRYQAFLKALTTVQQAPRAESVLHCFSDPTDEPVAKAGGPAVGAWEGQA
jgi:hypothetical protein